MDDWIDSDLCSDPAHSLEQKNRKLSATTQPSTACKKPATDEPHPLKAVRFAKASKEEIERLAKPYVPRKTEDATHWSVRTFKNWLAEHNRQGDADKVPENI